MPAMAGGECSDADSKVGGGEWRLSPWQFGGGLSGFGVGESRMGDVVGGDDVFELSGGSRFVIWRYRSNEKRTPLLEVRFVGGD